MEFINLTNNQRHIEEKMTFFLECFSFINDFLGLLPMYPFDHPISLVNKIRNEIANNEVNRCEYLGHHFRVLTVYFEFVLDKRKQPYKNLLQNLITPFLAEEVIHTKRNATLTKAQQKLINGYSNLLEDIEQLEKDLSDHLLDTAVERINHYISCHIPTHDHKRDLVQWAHIIVAYARLENFSKSEVYSFPKRILSKDIQIYQFPEYILKLKHSNPEKFVIAAEKHLKRRTLNSQLKGLKSIIEAPKHQLGWYLFPIKDTSFQHQIYKKIDIKINKVSFVWSFNPKLSMIRKTLLNEAKEMNNYKWYKKFFKRSTIIAMIQVNYERTTGSKLFAYRKVLQELSSINNYFIAELNIELQDILFATDLNSGSFEYNMEWPPEMKVREEDIANAIDNPYKQLYNHQSQAAEVLLNNESNFSEAYRLRDPTGLWQYLENIFWFPSIGNNKKVKACFTKIALRLVSENIEQVRVIFAQAVKMNWHGLDIGVTRADRDEIHQEIVKNLNTTYDLQKFIRSWKRPFLRFFLHSLDYISSNKSTGDWELHYAAIISELKSYRNFAQHQGSYNKYSVIKLEALMPHLVSRLRWEMIHEAKKSSTLTYQEFLKNLVPGYDNL